MVPDVKRMGGVPWRPALVALLLASAQAAATPHAAAGNELKPLLERMSEALRTLNYAGTLVYLHDNQLESMLIRRSVRGDQEQEHLISLNGVPREVHRDQRAVTCVMPDLRAISVDPRTPGARLWPRRHLDPELLTGHYQLHSLGDSRVAGRLVQVIGIIPKDELRYGYRFYLDEGTGLPLKTDLMDQDARPIEQIMFTSLDLEPPDMTPSQGHVEAPDGFRKLRNDPPHPQTPPLPPAWTFQVLPPGFRVQMHNHWVDAEGQRIEHFLLGDGLAALSLYVETAPKEDGLQGGAHVGAINAWGRRLGEHQVTAVGEVPERTVQWVIDSLRPISQAQAPRGDPTP